MENKIKCPACGHEFPVEDALLSKAEEHLRAEYEKKYAQQAAIYFKKEKALEKDKDEFEKKKERENELFKERLDKKVEEEKGKMKKSIYEEYDLKVKNLESENALKKEENKLLKQKELELLQKEAKLKERQEEMQLELDKKFLEKRDSLVHETIKKEQEKNVLKDKEWEKKFEDQNRLIDELQRKAKQGSVQMQGEIQEIALEDLLRAEFPFDIIDEVPKGVKGADVIQTVINAVQQVCGKIIYESKRTKSFSDSWIEKLKEDQLEQNAILAVIVTEVLPKEMNSFGRKDGVWICTYPEAKNLIFVLR